MAEFADLATVQELAARFLSIGLEIPGLASLRSDVYIPAPHPRAVRNTQSRYSTSGVTPVRPPQPALLFAPVDQLTTPMMRARPDCIAKAGAPESPVQAPRPS